MKTERRRNGRVFVLEAFNPDRAVLAPLLEQWPDGYIQWEAHGVPLGGGDQPRLSGATFALWRPRNAIPRLPELEDPADWLTSPAQPAPATAPPAPPRQAPPIPTAVPAAPPRPAPAPETTSRAAPPVATEPALDSSPASLPARRRGRPAGVDRTTKYKNLSRVNEGPKHRSGYLVRVTWQRVTRSKFFADAAHGDRLGSLAAALEWRDQTERELGKPHTDLNIVGAAASNTGLVGITRTNRRGTPVFQVTWYENGRQRRRTFNITRLGERRALREAQKLRQLADEQRRGKAK